MFRKPHLHQHHAKSSLIRMLCVACMCTWLNFVAIPPTAGQSNTNPADPGVKDEKLFDPNQPLERTLEGRVRDGFTLAAVGDCILRRPLSQSASGDPAFAAVLKILRNADATYGNLEVSLVDLGNPHLVPNPGPDDWSMAANPAVAKDLKEMGFEILSRANNHALDWGIEGMRETSRHLDEAGLTYGGVGVDAGSARSPRYFESAKGRVAIVSIASTFTWNTDALDSHGSAPGRAGISALHVKQYTVVPQSIMEKLQQLHSLLYTGEPTAQGSALTLFGTRFETGGSYSNRHEMDAEDLRATLRSVRQGRQNADLVILTIHSHEPERNNVSDSTGTDMFDAPAAFLRELAHSAIDSGADAFMTTGIHHIGPIEIYHGRPIFYGLGDFFFDSIDDVLTGDIYRESRARISAAFQQPERVTDADVSLQAYVGWAGEPMYESFLAEAKFEKGQLSELRLYPVDLGYGRPPTELGKPRLASPQRAQSILQRLARMSQPFGTRVSIENYVGVIRVRSD